MIMVTACPIPSDGSSNAYAVLTAEYASLFAEDFGRNPIINDEASFDLRPSFVRALFMGSVTDGLIGHPIQIHQLYRSALQ